MKRVFITENEVNGLAFPDVAASIVVFGGGYSTDRLADIRWLHGREIIYWGDIDTRGYAILDRLRAILPHAKSLLMDRASLLTHRALSGTEEMDKRYTGQLARLTDSERAVFEDLRTDALGERIRMEQERLGFTWVSEAIRAIA